MTRAEVVKWIGPPHEQDVYGRWHYRVFGASDMLHVEFDEKDRVKTVCF